MKKFALLICFALLGALAPFSAFAAPGDQETPLASANRFTTTNTADMYARQSTLGPDKGISVFGVVSALSTNTLTFTIQGKRPDGTYYTVLSSTASAATGTHSLSIYPGMTTTASVSASVPLPPVFRVLATHSNANTATYSIQVNRHR